MEVRGILKGLVGIIMIGCFLYQMWDLFDQFLGELRTVAVSFEKKNAVEFPSFAFCDSTAFTKKIGITSNTTLYNSSTFYVDVDMEVSIENCSYTVQYLPTTFNGYCKFYEFTGEVQVGTTVGE